MSVGARILVVEDNRNSNDLMCYLLRSFGHVVFSASDGVEGLDVAARERPDVIVLDLQMRRMGGFEAAAILAADSEMAAIPRVAVTAYAMLGDRERVLEEGFDGYIAKPIDPERFVEQIEVFVPEGLRSTGTPR
jgi:two-component system cell cycle response regulator